MAATDFLIQGESATNHALRMFLLIIAVFFGFFPHAWHCYMFGDACIGHGWHIGVIGPLAMLGHLHYSPQYHGLGLLAIMSTYIGLMLSLQIYHFRELTA